MKRWEEVYDFWIGKDPKTDIWFKKDAQLDQQVREKFGAWLDDYDHNDYEAWKTIPRGLLALVILLDQFPRNAFRGSARSFDFDVFALDAARDGLDRGYQDELTIQEGMFLILPFEHSEDITDQKEGVRLAQDLVERAGPKDIKFAAMVLDHAKRHHDIIEKFGRFPHRNEILGRASSPAETEFLRTPGSSF